MQSSWITVDDILGKITYNLVQVTKDNLCVHTQGLVKGIAIIFNFVNVSNTAFSLGCYHFCFFPVLFSSIDEFFGEVFSMAMLASIA